MRTPSSAALWVLVTAALSEGAKLAFVLPANLSDAGDVQPSYTRGAQVNVTWTTAFESTTLKLWQQLANGTFVPEVLAAAYPSNKTTYQWTVKPVSAAVSLNNTIYHLELSKTDDPTCTECQLNSSTIALPPQKAVVQQVSSSTATTTSKTKSSTTSTTTTTSTTATAMSKSSSSTGTSKANTSTKSTSKTTSTSTSQTSSKTTSKSTSTTKASPQTPPPSSTKKSTSTSSSSTKKSTTSSTIKPKTTLSSSTKKSTSSSSSKTKLDTTTTALTTKTQQLSKASSSSKQSTTTVKVTATPPPASPKKSTTIAPPVPAHSSAVAPPVAASSAAPLPKPKKSTTMTHKTSTKSTTSKPKTSSTKTSTTSKHKSSTSSHKKTSFYISKKGSGSTSDGPQATGFLPTNSSFNSGGKKLVLGLGLGLGLGAGLPVLVGIFVCASWMSKRKKRREGENSDDEYEYADEGDGHTESGSVAGVFPAGEGPTQKTLVMQQSSAPLTDTGRTSRLTASVPPPYMRDSQISSNSAVSAQSYLTPMEFGGPLSEHAKHEPLEAVPPIRHGGNGPPGDNDSSRYSASDADSIIGGGQDLSSLAGPVSLVHPAYRDPSHWSP